MLDSDYHKRHKLQAIEVHLTQVELDALDFLFRVSEGETIPQLIRKAVRDAIRTEQVRGLLGEATYVRR